jgi:hypothetical protein
MSVNINTISRVGGDDDWCADMELAETADDIDDTTVNPRLPHVRSRGGTVP